MARYVVALAAVTLILAAQQVAADRSLLDFRAPCNPTRNACGQAGPASTTTCTRSATTPPTPICGCKPGFKDFNPATKTCTPINVASPSPSPPPSPSPSPPTPPPSPVVNACTGNPCGTDPKYVCVVNKLSLKADCRCAPGYLGPYPTCIPNPLPDPCNPNPCESGPQYSCLVTNAIKKEFECQCATGFLGYYPDCLNATANPTTCSDKAATLNQHNAYRTWHEASLVEWDNTLAYYANKWAVKLAPTCEVAYDETFLGGQNVYIQKATPLVPVDGQCHQAVTWWYSQVAQYNWSATPFSDNIVENVEDFVQVVYDDTDAVGCGMSIVNGCKVVVCLYQPGVVNSNAAWSSNVFPRPY